MSNLQKIILFSVIGLILGIAGTYFVIDTQSRAQTGDSDAQLLALQEELEQVESIVQGKQQMILYLENEILRLENEVAYLSINLNQSEIQEPQNQDLIDSLETQISDLEEQVALLQSPSFSNSTEVQILEEQIETVLSINVTFHYVWTQSMSEVSTDLTIPVGDYWEYTKKNRTMEITDWVSMCKDPGDDNIIDQMAESFEDTATSEVFSDYETVNYILSFIQNLPYTEKNETIPWDNYSRYPVETLFEMSGDCVDKSILTAAILDAMGYDVALLVMEDVKHVAVGVARGTGFNGIYYDVYGTRYYYAETTGEGWWVGQKPSIFSLETVHVYPLKED
ncbi:MAG: hypothetical protein NWE89_14295 [Candidatus Bathyarchaeota archaeon]|nr:hypothetical protein [Candidatus Bathyarchaeota archaeon]